MKPIPSALSAPWAIEPQWLRVVYGVWSRGKVDAAALAQARADWQARLADKPKVEEGGEAVAGTGGTLRIIGSVGVLSVTGPLFRHADMFTEISGGTSYEALWRGLEAAATAPAVKSVLLRINSPGGEADGINELAKHVAALAERMPVWAFADNMCASAAYWLASQCSHIVAEETAEIGSIGVRCGILDDSKADEMEGLREIEIVSSTSPGKRSSPVDDEVIGRVQTRIDDLAAVFVEAVARGRGVDAETVLADFGQGDVMIAGKALAAGLVDEVGDFNSTLAALSAASLQPQGPEARAARARGATMAIKTIKPKAEDGGEDKPDKGLRCAKCEGDMAGKASYCATCYDGEHSEPDGDEGDEEAKALAGAGLLGRTRAETRSSLVGFVQTMLEATGAKTAAAAIARATSNATAAAQLEQLRAKTEADAATARQGAFADKLTAAIKSGRVTLAVAAAEVPLLLGASKGAARANLAAMVTQDAASVVAALSSVTITADAVEGLDEWLAAKPAAALPASRPAPSPTASNMSIVRAASIAATEGVEVDAQGNPIPSAGTKPANVFSIASLVDARNAKENVR